VFSHLYVAVLARRKSAVHGRRLACASVIVSASGIIVGLFLLIVLTTFFYPHPQSSLLEIGNETVFHQPRTPPITKPEVTSPPCHVIGNDTACFRFASKFAPRLCSVVGGMVVNVNASSTICYHNVCNDYVVATSCFQHRSATSVN